MGKDSLLKTTTAKQSATKAKAAVKPKKQTASGHKATGKAKTPANATAVKKTPRAAKPKNAIKTRKPAAAKTASRRTTKKVKPLFKKFKPWKPEKIFRPEPDITYLQNFVAPPFVSDKNDDAARRIKGLLFKKFDTVALTDKDGTPVSSQSAAAVTTGSHTPSERIETRAYTKRLDPMAKMLIYLATGFIIVTALVVAASVSNRSNYYIKATDGAVEIWRGRFAPIGKDRIIFLPGALAPETIKAVYTEKEIHTFAFNYYLERADTLLEVSGMPDFEGIKLYLNMALSYGHTDRLRKAAHDRLNNIDLMIYLYRADVAASKGTLNEYKTALDYLGKAAALNLDKAKIELVRKKIESIQELILVLESNHSRASAISPETPIPQKKVVLNPTESASK